jgi:hypothetical protein
MTQTTFVSLVTLWITGLTYLQSRCAALEGEAHPFGVIGALIGFDWLRGSSPESRRLRNLALSWAAAGVMVVVLGTRIAMRIETGF